MKRFQVRTLILCPCSHKVTCRLLFWGILFFAPLYLDTLRFALIYFDITYLPLFTLVPILFALLIFFLSYDDLRKSSRQNYP
jgi:hypothetical protein